MKAPLKGLAMLALVAGLYLGCGGVLVVREPPPIDRVEIITNSPGSDHMWIAGYWSWHAERRWEWREGHWERRPYPRAVWERGRWNHRDGKDEWEWREGKWVWGRE